MKPRDKYKNLYTHLKRFEKNGTSFTKKKLAEITGYSVDTIGIYIRNKLKNIYVFEKEKGVYEVRNLLKSDFQYFFDKMSQKSSEVRNTNSLTSSLISRSLEAFYSSIGIYNNPLSRYRIESFCILLINAWELLLKARIIEKMGAKNIYRKDKKTISITAAAKKLFSTSDPVYKNLKELITLRDNAVHLLMPNRIQNILSRIFQASILNFLYLVKAYKYPNSHLKDTSGLLSLITNSEDIDEAIIPIDYGDTTSKAISNFKKNILENEKRLNSDKYIIPIGYKLVLTKKESEGDLKFKASADGEPAVIVKVPKDPNKTHPYRTTQVIELVNEELRSNSISTYSFQGILELEKIQNTNSNRYYFLHENPTTRKYSMEFVEMIINKIKNDNTYIDKAKDKHKMSIKRRNKQKNTSI